MFYTSDTVGWQPSKVQRKYDDQYHGDDIAGNTVHNTGDKQHDLVDNAVLFNCGDHTKRNTAGSAHQNAVHTDSKGTRQTVSDLIHNIGAIDPGHTQIPPDEQIVQVVAQLHDVRPVKAQILTE